jgi:hypothetical protein
VYNDIIPKYCSKKCCSIGLKETMKGENNPNYGNNWTDDQREKLRQSHIKTYEDNPELRYVCGSSNRGKKFDEDRCKNMSLSKLGKPGHLQSIKSKLLIGAKSKERMNTDEMKFLIRKKNEESGRWVPLAKVESKMIYFNMSNWIKRMFDVIEDDQGLDKLKQFGVFNSRTNKKGIVRDHIYSRRSGFMNLVFPEILRHPCNCQLLTHAENLSKKDYRYIDKDAQSLDDLFTKIEGYSNDWVEQSVVLLLIQKYKNGERWINRNFKGTV